MNDPTLDLNNPTIRDMVLRNHQPEEAWNLAGQLVGVSCATCYRPWPCPSNKAAVEAEREVARKAMARGEERYKQARQAREQQPKRRWWAIW